MNSPLRPVRLGDFLREQYRWPDKLSQATNRLMHDLVRQWNLDPAKLTFIPESTPETEHLWSFYNETHEGPWCVRDIVEIGDVSKIRLIAFEHESIYVKTRIIVERVLKDGEEGETRIGTLIDRGVTPLLQDFTQRQIEARKRRILGLVSETQRDLLATVLIKVAEGGLSDLHSGHNLDGALDSILSILGRKMDA